jgi:hypothetical protein
MREELTTPPPIPRDKRFISDVRASLDYCQHSALLQQVSIPLSANDLKTHR